MIFIQDDKGETEMELKPVTIYPDADDMIGSEFSNGTGWLWVMLAVFAFLSLVSSGYGIYCFYINHVKPMVR